MSVRLDVFAKNINQEDFYEKVQKAIFDYYGTYDLNEWEKSDKTADNFLMELDLTVGLDTVKIIEADEKPIETDTWENLPF